MEITINGVTRHFDINQAAKGSLLDLLVAHDYPINHSCMGTGKCGKCKIKLVSVENMSISTAEKLLLSQFDLSQSLRLACYMKPQDQMKLELLKMETNHRVLTSGFVPKIDLSANVYTCPFDLKASDVNQFSSWQAAIQEKLPGLELKISALQTFRPDQSHHIAICQGQKVVGMTYQAPTTLYGLAIDIGTTTIVVTMVDLVTGIQLKSLSRLNPQVKYGLDVLSRISYAMMHEEKGLQQLQRLIIAAMNEMTSMLCRELQIDHQEIYEVVVAANPTMTHMLLGVSPNTIGKSPFIPLITETQSLLASEIGLRKLNAHAQLVTLPLVSAYVGSDVVAGAYLTQHQVTETILLIDIGTNGEIVLHHQGYFTSCSCAAGPALEGMNISSGMKAAQGAIEDIRITCKGIDLKVIGQVEPLGLCGSGVLAAVREGLAHGLINKRGRIVAPNDIRPVTLKGLVRQDETGDRWLQLSDTIRLSQADVRQIQLAKGAILAAIYTLLERNNLSANEVERVIVAGQFGAHIDEASLIGVGILPKEFQGRIEYIGNASHSGAYLALMNTNIRAAMLKMAQTIDYIELSTDHSYEKKFAKCAQFSNVK